MTFDLCIAVARPDAGLRMAPACAGCHLPALLKLLFVAALFCILCPGKSALLMYDRQKLTDLNRAHGVLPNFRDQTKRLHPHLASVPGQRLAFVSCQIKF